MLYADARMSDDITQDRSPRAPGLALEAAIDQTRKLHRQIGRASVRPEVAAKALGFSGLTGSSLATLATLTQYGLVERPKGMLVLSSLAIKLLHPTSPQQFEEALRQAALTPKTFQEIFRDFNECSTDVLESHLVQNDFSPERARRVAKVYTANKAFAKLGDGGNIPVSGSDDLFSGVAEDPHSSTDTPSTAPVTATRPAPPPSSLDLAFDLRGGTAPTLPRYTVPLSTGEVTLAFSSEALTREDFDKLKRYLDLFKEDFPSKSDREQGRVPPTDLHPADPN